MRIHSIVVSFLVTVLFLSACDHGEEGSSQVMLQDTPAEAIFHPSHEPKKANAPFSDAVQVGDLFFLSGQIGMDHSVRELVEGGLEAETHQAIKNIQAVLAQHDMELKDVVKAAVILADMADFAAFNEIYREYLPQRPARTTFAASGLARSARIEMEVVAYRKPDSK